MEEIAEICSIDMFLLANIELSKNLKNYLQQIVIF